ncbi:CGNR zinc finger domain-containing protein [Ciceribacter sp. L1K22]|uniref:CGNR zinc finger domain-containing protein n=1 Tax=Ciceribacter sp. L1K22 TaxID=2820275 RepID=UPI001ABDEEF2|nr:CGNR zinc finger domain-containing protein [Ciceribacter sp. L1K22]MBO3759714.1 CGNR zinc finger domain-containing protein [Ciceribacter sp. L1K22]
MTFSWTPHRFSGGALALDVANSVILRFDPSRSVDRFAIASQMDDFADAANAFCAEKALFGELQPVREESRPALIALREAIDDYFRSRTLGLDDRIRLARLLERAATCLRSASEESDLAVSTARSALKLLAEPEPGRMKICGNCGWLFLDRSKNRSRTWCDMSVCGNRTKANRHYRRKKETTS